MEEPIRPHMISIFAYRPSLRQTAVATLPHAGGMCRSSEPPLDRIKSGLRDLPDWLAEQPADQLGDVIIKPRNHRPDRGGDRRGDAPLREVRWLQGRW